MKLMPIRHLQCFLTAPNTWISLSISLFLFHIQFLHHTQIKQKLWKLRLKITARNLFAKMQNKRFNVSSLIGAFSAFDLICMKTSWIANKTRNGERNSDEMKEKTGVKTVNEMRKLKYYDNVIILEAAVWLNVIFFHLPFEQAQYFVH